MTKPHLNAVETESKLPILIIDPSALFANELAEALQYEFLPVLLTKDKKLRTNQNQRVTLSWKKKIPLLPDMVFPYIFVIYSGETILLEMLPSLLKKAQESKGKLVLLVSIFHGDERIQDFLTKAHPDCTGIFFGEVVGGSSPDHTFQSMLTQAKKGSVTVQGDGLTTLYPIQKEDAIKGVFQSLFADNPSSLPFLLFPRHGFSQLSVVRILQKHNPLLTVQFVKGKKAGKLPFIPAGIPLLDDAYQLERFLTEEMNEQAHQAPVKRRVAAIPLPRLRKKPYLIALLSLLFLPLLLFLIATITGGVLLTDALTQVEKNNLGRASQSAAISKQAFSISRQLIERVAVLPGSYHLSRRIEAGETASEALFLLSQSLVLYEKAFTKSEAVPRKHFINATHALKETIFLLTELEAEGQLPKAASQKLTEYQKPIQYFLQTADLLPGLLGFDNGVKYLVLLQNNMELRPGGGFIGSYGILSLKNGIIEEFSIKDVYDADGQLTAHVEPPYLLRRHIGSQHLFLRDSNFSPDFQQSASAAAMMLALETGESVDGVIGVDTELLRKLLQVTGPLTLEDYNEVVSTENFFHQLESHAQDNFFPGSTQKKDYLRSVTAVLRRTLLDERKGNMLLLIKTMAEAGEQKHLLVALPDLKKQSVFTLLGLGGTMRDYREKKEDVLSDYLAISEANVGLNKANVSIERTVKQAVQVVSDGSVLGVLTINYSNKKAPASKFSGDYKQYFRLYLPEASILQGILLDDKEQQIVPAVTDPLLYEALQFTPPAGIEVEKIREGEQTGYGLLLIVPSGETKKLTVIYELAKKAPLNEGVWTYDGLVLKQPGTGNDPYLFTITVPQEFKALSIPELMTGSGNAYSLLTTLSKDQRITLRFGRF